MLQTPWGDADGLRDRSSASGGGGREAVKRRSRERLFAAVIASCERKGYEATSVADLLDIAGVSRGTFYAHFDDKLDLFCATEWELIELSIGAATALLGEGGDPETRAREAFEVFIDLLVSQPAAGRMGLVESYAAGEPGMGPIRQTTEDVVQLAHQLLKQMPGKAEMPREMARAMVGGFYLIVYHRLHGHREAELPALTAAMWEWAMSYQPPPRPLRPSGRRSVPAPTGTLPPFAAYSPQERIIRAFAAAVADKGYPATTIADICATGAISQTTFYHHFADKKDLLIAALDSSGAQLLAATMPAARRAPDWPGSVHAAICASCAFLAAEPAFARLRMVELYSAGPEAIAIRDQTGMNFMRELLTPGFDGEPPEMLLEAIVGAIVAVFYERIRIGGPADLLDAAPLVTYLVLSPILGADEACEVALEPTIRQRH